MWEPRFTLGVVIVALAPAFGATQAIVSHYRSQRHDLAVEWTARGQRDFPDNPTAAVADFQTALSYSGGDPDGRLQLAQALIAAKRPSEAQAHLLTLWAEEPGNGPINLALARLAAAQGDVSQSVRYYDAAIDGAWRSEATTARRDARLELARFLISKGQNIRAQAELIALIDDLPREPQAMTAVAALLIEAGADTRAIGLLQRALDIDPRNGQAARLAGEIEFRSGNYAQARQYLAIGATGGTLTPDDQASLDVSTRVLRLDPSARGLTTRERARRLLLDFDVASLRLERCQALGPSDATVAARVADLTERAARIAKLTQRRLELDADLMDEVSDLVFAVEALPASACAPDSPDDRALQLVAARGRPSAQ